MAPAGSATVRRRGYWAVAVPAILCILLVAGHIRAHTDRPAAAATSERWGRHTVGVVVALGDSLTFGWPRDHGRRHPWTAVLARRLGRPVVNAGIPGNAVGVHSCRRCGLPGVVRLGADALAVPGIQTLIVLEGINDTMRHGSASEIIGALTRIAARAHRRGVRVIAGTLLPFGSYRGHTPARERIRQQVNAWIRSTATFDGVIDFAALMHAPGDPLRLNPAYDSGDGLHPNTLGYRVMGDAIPLRLFASARCPLCQGTTVSAARRAHQGYDQDTCHCRT